MSNRTRLGSHFHISYPESLEPRAMLAGHGGGSGGAGLARVLGGAAVFQQAFQRAAAEFTTAQAGARDQALAALGSHCGGVEQSTFTATLTDETTGESATITARTKTYDGETETSLTVNVTGATANTSLDISMNGEVVGQVETDDTGAGKVTLKDLTVAVADGTTVGVGALTGALALSTTSTPGNSERTVLRSELSDDEMGLSAIVKYKAFTRDDTTSSKLTVRVTGAAANETLDVAVDGNVVGQVTTDENGSGKVVLRDLTATITDGSTVTVGTISGTLETVATYHGRWHWHR